MIPVTITISGPGGCINLEVQEIEKLFRNYGYQVEVENSHPPINQIPITDRHVSTTSIKIVADHCPWGG